MTRPWWHTTTIYQVYPRSFADGDGDGIGDLAGIIDRLDHIAALGVETVWVSPFFSSPQRDFGYDIADYCDVAPEYGTLADAERLIEAAHARGLRVMFDLVLNHTSDEHPWFTASRDEPEGDHGDWYVWRDGAGDSSEPPNNWRSSMETRTAWQYSETRGQWYLATFLPFQPDLNWRNPEVRDAMFDVVRFWLDRGVDGFRLDLFGVIMKDAEFRPNAFRPRLGGGQLPQLWDRTHTENTEENFALARELRAVCEEYSDRDRVLLGEVFGPPDVLRRYLGDPAAANESAGAAASTGADGGGAGLHLVFLFDFLMYRYRAEFFRDRIAAYERNFPEPLLPTYVLENHDRSRSLSRVGGDLRKARVLATVLLTVRGVPTLYMGQEIGMTNTYLPLRDAEDPIAREYFGWVPEVVSKRLPERINRDEVRTPMQWDSTANAGFCPASVDPWLPVNPNHVERNVAAQTGDPGSLLELYRSLLALRRATPALHAGSLELLDGLPEGVLGYRRQVEPVGEAGGGDDGALGASGPPEPGDPVGDVVVVCNFTDRAQPAVLPGPAVVSGPARQVLLSTDGACTMEGAVVTLAPHSGLIVR
jgi:alpha-glucosidase